jgi:hypothetical protein
VPTKPRRRAPAPAIAPPSAPAATLTELQRLALSLGEAEAFAIVVEGADGSRVELRKGKPGATLVLELRAPAMPPEGA